MVIKSLQKYNWKFKVLCFRFLVITANKVSGIRDESNLSPAEILSDEKYVYNQDFFSMMNHEFSSLLVEDYFSEDMCRGVRGGAELPDPPYACPPLRGGLFNITSACISLPSIALHCTHPN